MWLFPYVRLLRSHPKPLAFGLLHSFFSSPGQTYSIAVFVPAIAASLDLRLTVLGAIYSAVSLASAAAMPYLGKLIDTVPLRRYSLAVGSVMAAGCLAAAAAPGIAVLTLGLFLMRLTGQGLMMHISATATARSFGPSRGKALGITGLGTPLGEAVFPVLIAGLIGLAGWRPTLLIIAALCLAAFLPASMALLGLRGEGAPAEAGMPITGGGPRRFAYGDLLRSAFFWRVLPLVLTAPFFLTGLIFHQGALSTAKGWSPTAMASVFFLFAAGHAAGAFTIGPLVDRFGAIRLFPVHAVPFALGVAVLWIGGPPATVALFLAFTGVATGFATNMMTAIWAEAYGTAHLGAVRSLSLTIVIFAAALAPVLGGALLDAGVPVNGILAGAIAYSVLAAGLGLTARRPAETA